MSAEFGWQGWLEVRQSPVSYEEVAKLSEKYMSQRLADEIFKESPIFQRLRYREASNMRSPIMRIPFNAR